MGQIPFVNQLGHALDVAIAERATSTQRRRRHWRPRWLGPRVAAGLAVLALGGGVAAAAVVISQSSTTLVAHGLACISGTSNARARAFAYNVSQNGQSPAAACAPVMRVPATKLIACAAKSGVIVYESSGEANQCQSLGLDPLPTDYTAATTQVEQLQRALTADYASSDCVPAKQLAQDADADLHRLGFVGWHAVIEPPDVPEQQYPGPCGLFPATGASISSAAAALDADNHTVIIETGPYRSILQIVSPSVNSAVAESSKSCHTLASAQQMVHQILDNAAGQTVPVEFGVTQEQRGTQRLDGSGLMRADGGQQYYDQGCTLVTGFGTTPDGQTILVHLENQVGPPPTAGGTVPASAYQPTLTQG